MVLVSMIISNPGELNHGKEKSKQAAHLCRYGSTFCSYNNVTASVLHIPTGNGYIHLGDSFIFLAASLLPLPYAIAAAAVGAGLADALTAPIWVIATVIIKSLIVLPFTSKKDKIINARNLIALIPALIVTCVGYYLADRILFGAWGAFAAVIPNVIQVAANAAIYVIFGLALDAAGFKKKGLK